MNLRGVLEHHARQVTGRERAIDISFKTLPAQIRQISAMINMGMAQDDRLEVARIEREMTIPLGRFTAPPLE